jgi:spermidine synthase
VKRLIIWSIIGTGISSIAVQLITIREFLSQFHGNEITISLVIFCWLFLTAIGSLLARFVKKSSLVLYALLCVFIALWPLLQLVCIRGFREAIFIHGLSPGFYQIFFYILATTTPYCLLVGFILPYSLTVLDGNHLPITSGELYITDNIGDVIGGMFFSFFLVYWMEPFKSIAFTSGLLVLVALWLLINTRNILAPLLAFLTTCIFYFFLLNTPFELSTLSVQYGNIVRYMEAPYGRIVITKEGPQHTFWESGIPLYSDVNIINSEEKIHYALSQLDRVERILLVPGGLGEIQDEISKYHPKETDYVELDSFLTSTVRELGFVKKDPSFTLINVEGRGYIKNTNKKYDAIIIDLPDPDTFQINRFFTSEFFSHAKKALNDGGGLSFSMKYSPNYISDVSKKKLSTVFNTAGVHFKNVLVLPGSKAYFLCRDGELRTDIPARLSGRSIQTAYIHFSGCLWDYLSESRGGNNGIFVGTTPRSHHGKSD